MLEGLAIPESLEESAEEEFYQQVIQPSTSKASKEVPESHTDDKVHQPSSKKRKRNVSEVSATNGLSENADLISLKLQLTIDILEKERELKALEVEKMSKESYLLSLKIYNFELKHGLPRSKFTENLGIREASEMNLDEPTDVEYLLPCSVNNGQSDEEFDDI